MSIEKQQDMEVLGVDLSPSMSIKDCTIVGSFLQDWMHAYHLAGRITHFDRKAK